MSDALTEPAQFQQQLAPRIEAGTSVSLPAAAVRANAQLFGAGAVPRSTIQTSTFGIQSADSVVGSESVIRATTDVGDLLGASPQVLNLGVQRRNPIVTDPRVRGSRVGSVAASGSYWVPARIDLDTAVSKLDSRLIDETTVVPGPYSSLYGPGFQFIDITLRPAALYERGFEAYGQSSVDFNSNGEQWYGRQSFSGGDDVWGFRGGYGHRTGNDYRSGAGSLIPSSYKSREFDVALTAVLTDTSVIDVHLLRLDQTDVELPGQAFDIDFLYTDAYEIEFHSFGQSWCDDLELSTWYNRTVLEGSAQRPGKRATFPLYDFIDFEAFTDVDSLSTGGRAAATWGSADDALLTAGADLRYVKQELNEIASGDFEFPFENTNSPIPRSHWSNPGLFAELGVPMADDLAFRVGGRADWVSTNIEEDPANLQELGLQEETIEELLGTDDFDRDELLGMGFASLDANLGYGWTSGASVGYAERAPTLTERYAVEPFMFLLQNGLNTILGDPQLDKERAIQLDVRGGNEGEFHRAQVRLFYLWARDYITFENVREVEGPPDFEVVQVQLRYRNTDMARFWGAEANTELDLTERLTGFGTVKYVQGKDRTIEEPLPSILPLESRIGVRLDDATDNPTWGVELACRVVDAQNRVAASLLESVTPGFTTWDVRSYWRPRERLLLAAGFENFTDKAYREHLDFRSLSGGTQILQPGFSFYTSAELTY